MTRDSSKVWKWGLQKSIKYDVLLLNDLWPVSWREALIMTTAGSLGPAAVLQSPLIIRTLCRQHRQARHQKYVLKVFLEDFGVFHFKYGNKNNYFKMTLNHFSKYKYIFRSLRCTWSREAWVRRRRRTRRRRSWASTRRRTGPTWGRCPGWWWLTCTPSGPVPAPSWSPSSTRSRTR